METSKVVIEAERLGLPATASPIDIRDKVHSLVAELQAARADSAKWQDRAEENQRELISSRRAVEDKKVLEGRLFIQQARDNEKIDADEVGFYEKLYAKDPELCMERVNGLRERRYLRTQESLRGPIGDPPNDPKAEVESQAAELMVKDESFRGRPKAAELEVLKRNPDLSARYREKYTAGVKPGGDQ